MEKGSGWHMRNPTFESEITHVNTWNKIKNGTENMIYRITYMAMTSPCEKSSKV
jgi:hypothetical protein